MIVADETVWKLKLGTVAAILLGMMSMAFTGMSFWVNNISLKVAGHGESIARLEECQRNTVSTLTRMESMLDDIRKDQVRRVLKEK